MKKLFKIALMMLTAITLGTSCNENKTSTTYSTFVTVVEGSWDIPYHLVFDDGTIAIAENYKDWTPSFTEEWKELRYIVYYTETDLVHTGYDKVINISAYQSVSTSKLINVTDADFTGDNGLQTYNGRFDIGDGYFSSACNFLTLGVVVPMSDSSMKHQIKIVRNLSENSPYKEHYIAGDGYLWLEGYYYIGEDSDAIQAATHFCLKIDETQLNIGQVATSYKGIKIIHDSYNEGKVKVHTIDFQK